MNFGAGGWDCVVVHPSVISPDPDLTDGHDELIRKLVKAQDLTLIDRREGDNRPASEILHDWLRTQAPRAE